MRSIKQISVIINLFIPYKNSSKSCWKKEKKLEPKIVLACLWAKFAKKCMFYSFSAKHIPK